MDTELPEHLRAQQAGAGLPERFRLFRHSPGLAQMGHWMTLLPSEDTTEHGKRAAALNAVGETGGAAETTRFCVPFSQNLPPGSTETRSRHRARATPEDDLREPDLLPARFLMARHSPEAPVRHLSDMASVHQSGNSGSSGDSDAISLIRYAGHHSPWGYNPAFMCNRLKFPFIKRERQVIFQLCPIGNSATPADARCTDPGIRGAAAVPKPFAERWHR